MTGAGGDLRQYLDGLARAESMIKYVEQQPFGQEAISKRSKSWNFYLKVIGSKAVKIGRPGPFGLGYFRVGLDRTKLVSG